MPLLRVRAAVAISKPLSQNREFAVCSSLSFPGHFNSVSVGAAKNPAASWVVCPTATLPAVAPRAGTSLSFVLLTLPDPPVPAHTPELSVSVWSTCFQAPGFSLVSPQPPICKSGPLPSAGGYCFPVPEGSSSFTLPFIFRYLCTFTAPHFVPQYSVLEMFVCRDLDVSSYVLG